MIGNTPRLLTLVEAAAYLRIGERTLKQMAIDGEIEASKLKGSWKFRKEVLEKYILENQNIHTIK